MKKVTAIVASTLLSTTAFAAEGFSGQAGLGYQTSSIDTNYGECWSECYGDNEPAGFAIEAAFNFGPGLFATIDYADTSDKEDMYDNDKIKTEWTDATVGFGYALSLNDTSAVTFALEYSDVEWGYEWKQPGDDWSYDADDDGVSLVIGGKVDVSDKLTAGASISGGFAEGVEAYTQYALADNFALKVSYSTKSYELGNFEYSYYGVSGTPSDENGDADYEVDTQIFRVGAAYTF